MRRAEGELPVADEEELEILPADKRLATAKDLVALLRIFQFTFDEMPDDDEAKNFTTRQ